MPGYVGDSGPRLGPLARWGGLTVLLALSISVRETPKDSGFPAAEPLATVAETNVGPISMTDLQRLEHLAWLVDNHKTEEESYVEAKIGLLARPMPDPTVGPVPHLGLPTDELSALERLRGSGHLNDTEYETLRRRVLLQL